MLPDLTVLVVLFEGLFRLQGGPMDPLLAVGGTLGALAVGVAMIWLQGERGVLAIRRQDPVSAFAALRWTSLWPLLAYLGQVEFFDWGTFVADVMPRETWILRYVVLYLPAAVLFPAAWIQHGRIEAAAAAARGATLPTAGPWGAVRDGLRRNGIALLPVGVVIGILDGVWVLGRLGVPGFGVAATWLDALPLLDLGAMLVVLGLLTFFLPLLMKLFFRTASLPPGPIRERLEAHAHALKLRYRDLLVWKTGKRVLNAMVVGFTPRTRLIFLTDALLEHLPEEEIHAVFAHEAGHAKRHHLPLFLVIFVATAVLFELAARVLDTWGISPYLVLAAELLFLWFVLLGSISRHFEREADLYGAAHATPEGTEGPPVLLPGHDRLLPAGTAWMMRALERIRRISGRGASHRHGTIETRVAYLAVHAIDPATRREFARRRRRLLVGVGLAVLVASAAVAFTLPGDIRAARAQIELDKAHDAYDRALDLRTEGRAAEARRAWRDAYETSARAASEATGASDDTGKWVFLAAKYTMADTALHGLEDEGLARREFTSLLDALNRTDLSAPEVSLWRFQAHVDLGRLALWAGDASALDHWNRAHSEIADLPSDDGGWFGARLNLLRGALLARIPTFLDAVGAGDPTGLLPGPLDAALGRAGPRGRVILRRLATGGGDGSNWAEIRRDARLELRRLGLSEAP